LGNFPAKHLALLNNAERPTETSKDQLQLKLVYSSSFNRVW